MLLRDTAMLQSDERVYKWKVRAITKQKTMLLFSFLVPPPHCRVRYSSQTKDSSFVLNPRIQSQPFGDALRGDETNKGIRILLCVVE